MDDRELIRTSKFLSLVLRHRPNLISIELDRHGWVPVKELLRQCQAHGKELSLERLQEVVERNSKKRFAVSEDGSLIRASQGHSVEVELNYAPADPPPELYHGTGLSNLKSIRANGLQKRRRHHVHLSADSETARIVGQRRGEAVLLIVAAGAMQADGHPFFLTANGVWLTEHVPAAFLQFPTDA